MITELESCCIGRRVETMLKESQEHEEKTGVRPSVLKVEGPRYEVLCCDKASIKYMLKDNFSNFPKGGESDDFVFAWLRQWLGPRGIFVLNHGEVDYPEDHAMWRKQRITLAPMFTNNNFKRLMRDTFITKAERLVELLGKVADEGERGEGKAAAKTAEGGGGSNGMVDMQRCFFAFTMDSIQQIFFGRDTDTVRGKHDAYAAAFDEAHHSMLQTLFKNLLVLVLQGLLPWPLGPWLPSAKLGPGTRLLFSFDKWANRFYDAIDVLDTESSRIIKSRREKEAAAQEASASAATAAAAAVSRSSSSSGSSGSGRGGGRGGGDNDNDSAAALDKKPADLLGMFLHAKDNDGNPLRVSDQYLRDVILNMIIAGRDTTACTLTWMFFELTQNLDVQRKLGEEIDGLFRRLGPDGRPTFDDVHHASMPYLNGVLYETLRLHPPVPEDVKFSQHDDVFPCGTKVPGKTRMVFSPYFIGRDPRLWPDPLRFDPNRWIPFEEPDEFAFPVFQAGPRKCLGQRMAIFEAKLLAAIVLRHFSFTLLDGEAEKITYSLMITMSLCNSKTADSHNLWLLPKRRAQAQ